MGQNNNEGSHSDGKIEVRKKVKGKEEEMEKNRQSLDA